MSLSYTYDTLFAAIEAFAEENDTEFVNNIPDFIGKAELRVLRDLDLELFEDWLEVTVSGGDRTVDKPNDVVFVNSLFVRSPADLRWYEVPRRSFEYCTIYAPVETDTAPPEFFSEFDETQIYVVPTPDQSYSGGNARIRATIRPSGLSDGNQNTWLATNVGDLLFHACMIEAHDFLKNTPAMEKAANKYMSVRVDMDKELVDVKRRKYRDTAQRAE